VRRVRRVAVDTFRSLRVGNFRLFFGGQIVSQIGNWLTLVAQTLLVLYLTDSGIALGLLAAAQFGPILILSPWAGLVADRSDKRRLLLFVQALAMVQSFALAVIAFSPEPSVIAIYLVAVFGGITMAFDNPARRAFVAEMVDRDDVPNAVSLNTALMTTSRVVGPALAGLLVATVGFGWCFVVDGASYLAVLAALWRIRPAELHAPPVPARAKRQVREGLAYIRHVPELLLPLVMMGVIGTLSYNFQTVFPLFATRDLHGTGTTFTMLFSVVSLGAVLGALVAARRRSVSVQSVAVAAIAYGMAMAAMAVVPNQATAFVVGVGLGATSVAFLTSSTAIMQMEATPEMRGRVLAVQAMLFLGSTPVGGPVLGWIAQTFGARYGIAVGAVAAIGAGIWGLVAARRRAHPNVLGATSPELAVRGARRLARKPSLLVGDTGGIQRRNDPLHWHFA
jgi:MFS family permease